MRAGSRVLMWLENNGYPGDTRVRNEALALTAAGFHVTVIAPRRGREKWKEVVDGVGVHRYPAPAEGTSAASYVFEYAYSMVATFMLSVYVAVTSGFDVIHAHNPPDSLAVLALPFKALGITFVFDHHDLSPEMYRARFPNSASPRIERALRVLERLSFWAADHVITTNESYRDIATGRGRVDPSRVTVVRNGPDLDRVREAPGDPDLRRSAGFVIGYVGTLGPQDGVDYLIRAVDHLVNRLGRTDVHCVIVGTGPALQDLRRLVDDLDLTQVITLPGRLPDDALMSVLSTADVCADPDPSNPFNDRSTMIKIAEYMALGKPIVAFDLPEHRVTAGDAAFYAAPNDVSDFAARLADLMDDPSLREAMGARGRARAEEVLAWEHQAPRLVEAYETITGPETSSSNRARRS